MINTTYTRYYETSDGKKFESIDDAKKRELEMIFENNGKVITTINNADEFAKFILLNRGDIGDILKLKEGVMKWGGIKSGDSSSSNNKKGKNMKVLDDNKDNNNIVSASDNNSNNSNSSDKITKVYENGSMDGV
jgi:hypothetical protein